MKERHIATGKVFYDTGELFFEGSYYDDAWKYLEPWRPLDLIEGIVYYKNGKKYREGSFQRGGLLVGKEYYESGVLKFEGVFNDKYGTHSYTIDGILINEQGQITKKGEITIPRNYYGPPYPIEGKFYSEDGTLIHEGEFKVVHTGSLGWPKVVIPEEYGKLGWLL
ncbi:MAG: hypothetical protein LUC94_02085 [Clostridiales bacterium]|nr:hypothetical protein [Clostridiales bacterium]